MRDAPGDARSSPRFYSAGVELRLCRNRRFPVISRPWKCQSALSSCEGQHAEPVTGVAGIEIPSTIQSFWPAWGLMSYSELACPASGAIAMLSQKRSALIPSLGRFSFWCLAGVCLTMAGLAAARWAERLGEASGHFPCWQGPPLQPSPTAALAPLMGNHITGMGGSYVLLMIAFYVDNGKQLPIWKDLPPFSYWLVPARPDQHSTHPPRPIMASPCWSAEMPPNQERTFELTRHTNFRWNSVNWFTS